MLHLTEREKLILFGGSIVLSIMLFLAGLYKANNLLANIKEQEDQWTHESIVLQNLGREYRLLKNLSANIVNQKGASDVTIDIEKLLVQNNLKSFHPNLIPRRSKVEKKYIKSEVQITFKEIPMQPIFTLINQVENYPDKFLKITNLATRPLLKKVGYYSVSITIATFLGRNK